MFFVDMALTCAPLVSPETLAAIVKTESHFNPLAISINAKPKSKVFKIPQPKSELEAIHIANSLINAGFSIDMGLGQINSKNLPGLGLTVENIFNPCVNLKAAGTILQTSYSAFLPKSKSSLEALHKTLSAYNTGSPSKGLKNGYVKRVIANSKANIDNNIQVPSLVSKNENIPTVVETAGTAISATSQVQAVQSQSQIQKPENSIMVYESEVSATVQSQNERSILVY